MESKVCSNACCPNTNPQPISQFYFYDRRKGSIEAQCKDCRIARSSSTYTKSKDKKIWVELRRKYWPQLTSAQARAKYEGMMAAQGGKCVCCLEPLSRGIGKSAVDHDHITGKVRALLCGHCNRALGYVKENFDTALRLARYIQEHKNIV